MSKESVPIAAKTARAIPFHKFGLQAKEESMKPDPTQQTMYFAANKYSTNLDLIF